MSYVVLARKYRPQRFEDMVGQAHIGRTLSNAIDQDRVHHAYLFAGARGLGKTTTARILAKGLVCEQGPTAVPCNACEQCRAINEGRSVDVMEVDGASNNSVDNIRNLREQVHYLPQSARRKVYIIDEVHMLSTSAFNALLKTLEEPPAHVSFVFATTEPHKVLPTILSRVSRLDFRRVTDDEQVAHLRSILDQEKLGVDDAGLRLIARAAEGSVRDALTLLDQVLAFGEDPAAVNEAEVRRALGQAERVAIAELVAAILARDPDGVIARFDELVGAGHDLLVLSLQIVEYLRDLVLVKVCRDAAVLRQTNSSELERLRAQAADVEVSVLGQLFDRFTRLVDRLPTSRMQRILLEMGLLDLVHAEPLVPVAELLARLDGGSKDGGGGSSGSGSSPGGRAPSPSRTPRKAPSSAAPATSREPTATREANGAPQSHAQAAPEPSRAPDPAPVPLPAPPRPPSQAVPKAPPQPTEPLAGSGSVAAERAALPSPPGEPLAQPSPPGAEPPAGPSIPTGPSIGDSEVARGLWSMVRDLGRPETGEPEAATPTDTPGATPQAKRARPRAKPRPPIDLDALPEFDAWEQLIVRIRREDEYVSAILSELGLVTLAGGILCVCAARGSFAHTELNGRPEIRGQIEQATRDHFGRSFALELREGQASVPDAPSLVLVTAARREELQERVQSEAREHPGIRAVLRTFEAELTQTKPLAEP